MGPSPDDSVLNENAEARSVKRLFVADNSALAIGIGGLNPTLTTQAPATRTAEEAPVSSVDPAVTHAVLERGL